MELNVQDFKDIAATSDVMLLATSAHDEVSVRPVSPLLTDGMTVFFYTSNESRKYRHMKENGRVAFSIGPAGNYQGEGTVRFLGGVFSDENTALNAAYRKRYPGAFEIAAPGEDMETNEFLAIDVKSLKGWVFSDESPEMPIGLAEATFA